ncbi:MAG: hypothetical protein COV07_01575 [Candidatus Vogelbacteria bacterium CG10_big_fil_rev_8_21_14_0_10_45_14]|uniref:Uncharacterized protein n=1 Tax=Candidatus Vogelbacteria bacterium CG10_big_fil_rev_8_21_14_0_10_45_14 TaxID=1975042 RepID=A0A2H0RLQ2_9BACT|nr:MAG: hypothetical protein COV07_01575 [Candidatus Vogelbacteria bacterium CG10_big_fil_rev_8_21_14_0_10_45_14]
MDCENCYDSGNCFKNYNCAYTFQARQNVDCKFLSYSGGCTNCFASTNLKNKSYVFLNEQLTKEEYQKKVGEIDLGSYKVYEYWKDKARDHWKKYPPRPAYDDFSVDCEGSSYIFESKNCKDSFEVVGAEDCRFLDLIASGNVKDTYDLTQFGANLDMVYDSCEIGKDARDIQFSFNSGLDLMDVRYSAFLTSTAHHFGCVSVRKSEYCILNKQYSKEEFDVLKKRIIKDMEENPYVSKEGHVYKYGEFFPPEFSPHAYNGTFANFFFPLSKEDVLKKGLRWLEPEEKEYKVTIVAKDLPDNIKDVEDSLLKDVIGCMKCKRGFRVIKKELEFLRSNCLPLPRNCPFCRIGEKIELWIKNRKLIDRVCDKCGVDFKTYCDKERAPHVLCKKCYLAEVV